jgi:hypothetical protein
VVGALVSGDGLGLQTEPRPLAQGWVRPGSISYSRCPQFVSSVFSFEQATRTIRADEAHRSGNLRLPNADDALFHRTVGVVVLVSRTRPALPVIQRTTWNEKSPKLGSRILHTSSTVRYYASLWAEIVQRFGSVRAALGKYPNPCIRVSQGHPKRTKEHTPYTLPDVSRCGRHILASRRLGTEARLPGVSRTAVPLLRKFRVTGSLATFNQRFMLLLAVLLADSRAPGLPTSSPVAIMLLPHHLAELRPLHL